MQMYVDVGGVRLFCEKHGQGAPLILVHGNGEDHTIFDQVLPLLSQNFTVYALDSRGHGRSSRTNFYDYGQMAGDVAELIRVLDLEKPVYLGFSDGGIIGLILASEHPGLLSRLVVCGANTDPKGLTAFCRFQIHTAWRVTHDPRQELMLTQPHISQQQLADIAVPTLVLAGEKDVVTPAHTQALAAAIPGARLCILPGQTHTGYVVHSPLLYWAVQQFLLDV